jgi:hypothetical protein
MLMEELHVVETTHDPTRGQNTMDNFNISQRARVHYDNIWQ